MNKKWSRIGLVLSLSVLLGTVAQAQQTGSPAGDNIQQRLKHQHKRIKHAIEQGTITKQQADKLMSDLDNLSDKVDSQRRSNGGQLNPEQLRKAESALNQTNELIKSFEGAGTSVSDSSKKLGPTWTPGPDGAQNPAALKRQMRQENRRELRQEHQANEQVLEQQQLDYERQMLPAMAKQRKNIIKQKQDVDQIRKESGSN